MDSEWILWGAVLLLWPLAGVLIAYVCGNLVRGPEEPEDSALMPKVPYVLRRRKRTAGPLSASTGIRVRRVAGLRNRH